MIIITTGKVKRSRLPRVWGGTLSKYRATSSLPNQVYNSQSKVFTVPKDE